MISPAQAFRVWRRMFLIRDYPFPPERKWLVGILLYGWLFGPSFVGLGFLMATSVQTGDLSRALADADFSLAFTWTAADAIFFAILGAWTVGMLYMVALYRYWLDVGQDRWLNAGHPCRSCGDQTIHTQPLDRYTLTTRFRQARKTYAKAIKERKRSQRAEQGSAS